MTSATRYEGNEPFRLGNAHVIRETDKAIRVGLEPGSAIGPVDIWIPRSVLHDDSEVYGGNDGAAGQLVVKQWFARKEGWVCE